MVGSQLRYLFQQLLLSRSRLQRGQLSQSSPEVGELAAFCPFGPHLPRCSQGSTEELGGAGPERKDEHTLLFLGLVVISQHAPERKRVR